MHVVKGTYRTNLYDFVKDHERVITPVSYTMEDARYCIELMLSGVLQYLKLYTINGKLCNGCKMINIIKDFLDNKFTDKTGRYFSDYSSNERFFLAHCINFDYTECIADDNENIKKLADIVGFPCSCNA